MGASVKQEDTFILMPISSFGKLTEEVAQNWITYGKNAAFECMRLYPSLAEAFFNQYSILITSLRNNTTEKNIPEHDRCTHFVLMLASTSSLTVITQEMLNQFTSPAALRRIETAQETFYKNNPKFIEAAEIEKRKLPNAKTVYSWFTEKNSPPWAVTKRMSWIEETYNPPIDKGLVTAMLRTVIAECLPRQEKTVTNINILDNRKGLPADVACDRRDHSSRPVPPDNAGIVQQSPEPRSLRHH